MNLTKLAPVLYTTNMKETIDYYVQLLDFTLHSFDTQAGWATVRFDSIEIVLSIPNKNIPFDMTAFTGSIYLQTENIDEWWMKLKDKTTVCYAIEDFAYGRREFGIYDNNGYLLQFAQPLKENKK